MDPRPHTGYVPVICPLSNGCTYQVPYRYGVYQVVTYIVEINICDHGSGDPACKRCMKLIDSYLSGGDDSDSRFLIASKAIK